METVLEVLITVLILGAVLWSFGVLRKPKRVCLGVSHHLILNAKEPFLADIEGKGSEAPMEDSPDH